TFSPCLRSSRSCILSLTRLATVTCIAWKPSCLCRASNGGQLPTSADKMETSTILDVRNIVKHYGQTEVLKGISLKLSKCETKVLIGPSGAGTSTLLRSINFLAPPDAGEVYLAGTRITDANINQVRARVGFVFQDFNLCAHLTALD